MTKVVLWLTLLVASLTGAPIGSYTGGTNTYNFYTGTLPASGCTGAVTMICDLSLDGVGGLESLVASLSKPGGVTAGVVVGTTDLGNTANTSAWIYQLLLPNSGGNIAHSAQLVSNLSSLWVDSNSVLNGTHTFFLASNPVETGIPEPGTNVLIGLGLLGLAFFGRRNK